MPGRNCCIPGCHVYHKKGGVSIFNVPKQEDEYNSNWRDKLISIVTKYREIDSGFRDQIRRKDFAICEIHYKDSCKIRRKFISFDSFGILRVKILYVFVFVN